MKRYRINDLPGPAEGHVFSGILGGAYINRGGLTFKAPGERTHTADGPDGSDRHVHDDCEAFVILQGKATMEIDGQAHALDAGDICLVEPGEDHHLISDLAEPCVSLWLHAGPERNDAQEESPQ
jgi:quercetin dioxygenase-like cupin family protein